MVITLNASSQTNSNQISVKQSNMQSVPHYYLDNDGTLSISQDGGFTWQKVGKTILEEKDFTSPATFVTISPSPMKSDGKLTLKLTKQGMVEITLMTIAGKVIQAVCKEQFPAGEQTWNIETGQLASGVYICAVTVAGKTTRTLFTLQK